MTGVIAARGFDLGHFRAQVRQCLAGTSASQNPGQFDHTQAGQWALGRTRHQPEASSISPFISS
jgi:hypothetical protein